MGGRFQDMPKAVDILFKIILPEISAHVPKSREE
jgi:hypothetical protein